MACNRRSLVVAVPESPAPSPLIAPCYSLSISLVASLDASPAGCLDLRVLL